MARQFGILKYWPTLSTLEMSTCFLFSNCKDSYLCLCIPKRKEVNSTMSCVCWRDKLSFSLHSIKHPIGKDEHQASKAKWNVPHDRQKCGRFYEGQGCERSSRYALCVSLVSENIKFCPFYFFSSALLVFVLPFLIMFTSSLSSHFLFGECFLLACFLQYSSFILLSHWGVVSLYESLFQPEWF